MLEFLLWAAARAAKFNGYCGSENRPTLIPLLFIVAAYYGNKYKIKELAK